MKCRFCEKDCKNRRSLIQHEIRCKKNPDKLDLSYLDSNRPKAGHKGTNQFIKAKELGLSAPEVLEETKQKQSNAQKGRKHTEEDKLKLNRKYEGWTIIYVKDMDLFNKSVRLNLTKQITFE